MYPILPPADKCIPFKITNSDSLNGARIGGYSPYQVSPHIYTENTRYFLTIPFFSDEGEKEISIFIHMAFEEIYLLQEKIFYENDLHIEAIVHKPQMRDLTNGIKSDLGSHALAVC